MVLTRCLVAASLLAIPGAPVLAATPASPSECTVVSHRSWLSRCLELTGPRNPPDWQWPISASGYYAQVDLVREFTSNCASMQSGPVDSSRAGVCTWQSHVDWLSACVRELEELDGKTRADLMKLLATEGGLSTDTFRHYQHRRCFPVKAEVTFDPVGDTPPEGPADLVVKVVPYIGWFVAD